MKKIILVLFVLVIGISDHSCGIPITIKYDTPCPPDPIPMIGLVNKEDSSYFDSAIRVISSESGARVDWIMATIMIESSFKEDARNPHSNAYGLIQFMPKTLRGMGISESDIEADQMRWVIEYFRMIVRYFGRIETAEDTYLAVFYPKAIGKPLSYRLGGPKVYQMNKALDTNHDGILTKADIKHKIEQKL